MINLKNKINIPLGRFLILPFLLLILISTSVVSFISYYNSQNAVADIAHKIRNELILKIKKHIHHFLNEPIKIISINKKHIENKLLSPYNMKKLKDYFYTQISISDSITSNYFANHNGDFAGSGKEGDGKFYYVTGYNKNTLSFEKHSLNNKGKKDKLIVSVKGFNPLTRPWYRNAIINKQPAWNDAYILISNHDLAISASAPVYSKNRELLGVVSVDVFLSHISRFLQSLKIGKTGKCYIIDQKGFLIATSKKKVLNIKKTSNKIVRIKATESSNKIIKASSIFLKNLGENPTLNSKKENLIFSYNSNDYYIDTFSISDKINLKWTTVIIIPKSDFMSQISKNNLYSLYLIILSLTITAILGILLTRKIAHPLRALDISAKELKNNFSNIKIDGGFIKEINSLTETFNGMSEKLQSTMTHLKEEISEKEKTQVQLNEERAFTEAAIDAQKDTFFVFDPETGEAIRWNRSFNEASGFSDSEIKKKKAPEDWYSKEDLIKIGNFFEHDYPHNRSTIEASLITKNNESIPTEYSIGAFLAAGSKKEYFIAIGRNLTDRIAYQKNIEKSLVEKEALLRELHHRTKNNMNVISAILKLQIMHSDDEKINQVFNEVNNKIRSMSLVHQKLYRSQNLSSISFKDYIIDLSNLIQSSYTHNESQINIAYELEDFQVTIDVAIPCGLICNELLSNIYKHAEFKNNVGTITISASKSYNDTITLTIADNGKGMQKDIDLQHIQSLGLQTVHTLSIHQLRGKINYNSDDGLKWTIEFKDKYYNIRI